MPLGAEAVVRADLVEQLEEFVIAEFDHLVAFRAVKVVVGRIAVVVLEGVAIGQAELSQETGLDKQPQRPIDGRAAHLMSRGVEVSHKLISIKVLVCIENMSNQDPPRIGQLVPANFEEFSKLLDGVFQKRRGDQQIVFGFSHGENPWSGPARSRPLVGARGGPRIGGRAVSYQ